MVSLSRFSFALGVLRKFIPSQSKSLVPTFPIVDEFFLNTREGRFGGGDEVVAVSGPVVAFNGRLGTEYAVELRADVIAWSPWIVVGNEHRLRLVLKFGSTPTAEVEVFAESDKQDSRRLCVLSRFDVSQSDESSIEIDLAGLAAQRVRFGLKGAEVFGVVCFQCAPAHRHRLINAKTNYHDRLRAEIGHFSGAAYTHPMYGNSSRGGKPGKVSREESSPALASEILLVQEWSAQASWADAKLAELAPLEGEAVYNFAMRCLGQLLPMRPPNFQNRLAEMSSNVAGGQSLRVLSLCSGAARVEAQILQSAVCPVEITLFDASEDLLSRAATMLEAEGHRVKCILGDINNGLPGDDVFDLVICVSALHHVVELEAVIRQINIRLRSGGEFWSIGEQVGRNGNRLWPDAQTVANEAFEALPAHLRRNATTGNTDVALPDRDFSLNCFEGIRSEELLELLESALVPVDIYVRNSFLWRMVDTTYCDNYDLTGVEDVRWLKSLIRAEAIHWVQGGRGTELHGVYRKRSLQQGC